MLEPSRLIFLVALLSLIGGVLLLSELPWFRRTSLTTRLLPHGGASVGTRPHTSFKGSLVSDVLRPLAVSAGAEASALLGVREDLARRLERARMAVDPAAFRLRQMALAGAALTLGVTLAAASGTPLAVTALLVLGAPALVFLVIEQQVANAIATRQRRTFAELPLVAEQIAMLLGAGYSLNAALNRVSERLQGAASTDLRHVCDRIRHGLSVSDALSEWATEVDIPELHRLVAVLSLTTQTSDLGRLVSLEAETIRRESQRQLIELIEKRGQQVWIPVTVATLIPGVIFLCIPFLQALQLLSGS